jgi:anti-sigma regulatory factor (Ser/Thr protein kinase)
MRAADRISLTPTASEVSRFNTWFDQRCAERGISKTLAADLKLCINEVLANAISYGFKKTASPWVKIRIRLDKHHASATIIDNGAYFDLPRWQVPKDRDLTTGEPGGFGIALIKERASQIRYSRFCGRNHLRIVCAEPGP